MTKNIKSAAELHENVPPNWYYQSLKVDPLQRYWHKRRFEEIGKLIEPVKGKVLDVGSADGMFSKVILDKTKAKELVGIEVLKSSVNWANKHWKRNKKMKFMVGDAHNLDFKSNTFDAVFCLEVLEHVYQPREVLKEFKRVLKKGGYGIFLVPSDSLLFRSIWFLWLNFYPRGGVWKETHIQTYRDNFLPKICKEAGFKVEKEKKFILGMLHAVKVKKE
ncbi:MAG: methyltransferase domain-containing protein [Patescibacteria group bacterium]|jgi:ubiquinone/menaquinone biosynthesis C-methylase UbiE